MIGLEVPRFMTFEALFSLEPFGSLTSNPFTPVKDLSGCSVSFIVRGETLGSVLLVIEGRGLQDILP